MTVVAGQTIAPVVCSHVFRRSDHRLSRMKPDEIIGRGTRVEINATAHRRVKAILRWAERKTRRLSEGKAFAYQPPRLEYFRDASTRELMIRVEWAYAVIDRPDGEVWIMSEENSR